MEDVRDVWCVVGGSRGKIRSSNGRSTRESWKCTRGTGQRRTRSPSTVDELWVRSRVRNRRIFRRGPEQSKSTEWRDGSVERLVEKDELN